MGQRVKFKFKYDAVVVEVVLCCDICKVGNVKVTCCQEKQFKSELGIRGTQNPPTQQPGNTD